MRKLTAALVAFALTVPVAAFAAGGSSSSSADVPAQSPEQLAVEYYNRGLEHRDRAWELEERAVADGDKAEKLLTKAAKEWKKAARAYREAIDNNPLMFKAHGSLGYALRKQGHFEESLGAYNRALELAPDYVEAIEYRAEAYLGLDRLEEAKEAYLALFRLDRGQADTLMTAMRGWLDTQRGGETTVSEESLEAFSTWVEERAEIASQTAMLTRAQGRSW